MAAADVQPATPDGANMGDCGTDYGSAPVFDFSGDFDSDSDGGSSTTTSSSDRVQGAEYDEVSCAPSRHGLEWLSKYMLSMSDELV